MRTHRTTSVPLRLLPFTAAASAGMRCPAHLLAAREPEASWDVMAFREDVPPATLEEARAGRAVLARLLDQERSAAVDFLLALADFDRRRGWERLGHASLFAFLTSALRLSKGAAYLRLSAARLLPRHPAVEAALRRGDLCLSAAGEVARVLTPENEADVLPKFYGCSAREAREVSAALLPVAAPPRREVVTKLPCAPAPNATCPLELAITPAAAGAGAPGVTAEEAVRAHEPLADLVPSRVAPPPAVEPLTAELRRLHLTVSKAFLDKAAAARTGLSHALPGASLEEVLEAALDLLLERQARRKGLGKRAKQRPGMAAPRPSTSTPVPAPRRPSVPAAVEREVRLRDENRCQFPLDGGGVCGSTWQVELDHLVPVALGGATTPANLRCGCRRHNQAAAETTLGPAVMAAARRPRTRRGDAGRPP